MQRLYSMFPGGAPGAGLLVLRLAVMLCLFASNGARSGEITSWGAIGLAGAGLGVALGALTPLSCLLAGVLELHLPGLAATPVEVVIEVLATLSLGILGPGAYSLDARLFGRRLIVSGKD